MTAAGWYDDPSEPGRKRYWDGARWTEHVHGVAAAGGPTRLADPPPFAGSQGSAVAGGSASGGAGSLDGFNDLGEWLNRSFRVVRDHWQALAIQSYALPFPFFVAAYLVTHGFIGRMGWDRDADRLDGFSVPWLAASLVALGLACLVAATGHLASLRHLTLAHLGRPPATWIEPVVASLARLHRFLAGSLVVYLAVAAALGVPIALFVYAVIAQPAALPVLIIVSVLLLLAAVPFLFWWWVRSAFVGIAAGVAPSGTSVLGSSWRISAGRFWPITARLAIVAGLLWLLNSATQLVGQTLGPNVLVSGVELTDNDLLIGGESIDTVDVIAFADVVPNPVWGILYFTLLSLFSAAGRVIASSAHAAVYVDADGPSSD